MPSRSLLRPTSEELPPSSVSSEFGSEDHVKENGKENYNTTDAHVLSQKAQKRHGPMVSRFRRQKIPDGFSGP